MANGLKSFLFNPFALLFFTACLGIALGRVKIKKFCLGACGTLVVGLAVGWLVILSAGRVGKSSPLYAAASKLISQGVISKEFFNLFLILFVVSLGLISGKEVVAALRQYGFKFLSIGFLITLLGFATTTALIKTTDVNPYQLSGVYSGAMLSTPADRKSVV